MIACRLCGSPDAAPLFLKSGSHFWRCGACGFQWSTADGNANLDNAIADFEPAYRQYLEPSPADEANHAATLAWIERFTRLDAAASLLDVGAGTGKFLAYVARSRPCRTAGLEPSRALYEAYDLGRRGIRHTTLPELAASAPGAFTVVTVLDVIEHVADPMAFARALARVTAPGAFVFVSTPDVAAALPSMLGRYWHHYNRYHLSLFNARTLARLADAAGFVQIDTAHRSRRMSLSYAISYGRDFVLRSRGARAVAGARTVPVNLFDVLSVVWRKRA